MKYRIMLIAAILISLVMAEIVKAEEFPPSRWWRIPKIADQLNLTEQDKMQLDRVFQDSRRNLRDLRDQVEDNRLSLEDLMGREKLNEQAVYEQLGRLSKSRTALEEASTRYFLEIRKAIGAEKFKEAAEIAKVIRQNRRFANNPGKD
jgi:Spy/CpxP family protein refolding chaperone